MIKTYKAVVEKPRLVIEYDTDAESPRSWDNLGYFITVDSRYNSPDDGNGKIYYAVKYKADEAQNQADHIKRIKQRILEDTGEKVLAIYPVVKYEHGGVSFSLGEKHGFDNSNNGFYIVTDRKVKNFLDIKKKDFVKVIKQELKEYTQWANGEVYGFTLYGKDGEVEDSCWGFYSLDDIKENLPKEWQNEDLSEYVKN